VTAASDFKPQPRERDFSRLNQILIVLIAVVLAAPIAYQKLPLVREKALQETELASAEAQLEETRMLHARLTKEVSLLETDPEYLGVFARDLVDPGYMDRGETIFRFPIPTAR
jgi:cell division protein FtsB